MFDFVHCDIWGGRYFAIPDRVFAATLRRHFLGKKVNSAADEILAASQEYHSCG
jgi:hypothetical protein